MIADRIGIAGLNLHTPEDLPRGECITRRPEPRGESVECGFVFVLIFVE
jgi:hypothetical protein